MSAGRPHIRLVSDSAASGQHETLDDDALVCGAQQGDDAAFAALVRRHQQAALSVALKYLHDPAAAADVVQDAFVTLHKELSTYVPRGRFRSYLVQLVLNRCRTVDRSLRRARRFEGLPVCATSGTPTDRADAPHIVERALSKLKPQHRDVVVLRFALDLSHDEIAEILQIPVSTARRQLVEALATLRDWIDDAR